jgi:hypothetical protein
LKEVSVFARHVTIHGSPDKVDEAVQSVKDHVLPALRDCTGFQGQLLLVDRANGDVIGISLRDTEENMKASEDKVSPSRQQVADRVDASGGPEVHPYELPIFEH